MNTIRTILYTTYLLLALSACKKDSGPGCVEGKQMPVTEIFQQMQPYRPGDSLEMEVFHRVPIDSQIFEYTYLGNISMAVTDSFTKEEWYRELYSVNCHSEENISQVQVIDFTGDSSLRMTLRPFKSHAKLNVSFAGIGFGTNTYSVNKESKYYIPDMQVNGKWYSGVNLLRGSTSARASLDSTYMFYSTTQGIIRFVINNEYVFERL